jgi:hypothetical protein
MEIGKSKVENGKSKMEIEKKLSSLKIQP